MSDEDKPFVCSQPGCVMQFTNEDHLAVHMRKHDMSLALNLTQGNLSPLGLFTDQTPTPTKFLKNCEELGLFQELSKNPFDDSFKKAMDDPMDHVSVEDSLHLPNPDTADLDTPQPPVPRIVIGDEEIRENKEYPEKPKDLTVSSIVPKKRKKFLSQAVLSMPTSTTSEDEEEAVIVSSTELNGSSGNVDTRSVLIEVSSSEPVQSPKRYKGQLTVGEPENVTEPMYTAQAVSTTGNGSIVTLDEGSDKTVAPVISSPMMTVTSAQMQSQPALATAPMMVQVLLQLPGGQVVPVQVPASNIASSQQVVQKQPQQGFQLVSPVTQTVPTVNHLTQNSQHVILPGNTLLQTPSGIIQNTVPLIQKSPQQTSSLQTGLQAILNQSATHPTLQTVLNQSGSQSVLQSALNQSIAGNIQTTAQSALRTILVANKQTGLQTPQNNATQIMQNALALNQSNVKPQQKVAIPGSQSYTKQRLKAAIQQQTTPSSAQKYLQAGEIKSEPQWSPGSAGSAATVSSPEAGVSSGLSMSIDSLTAFGSESGYSDSADTDVKREKFLERNRAAAARCRQKRKQWVVTLERKAEDLSTINNKLCSEIKKLRGEVANLKTMLIAHKDCPVTIQQRSQGQLAADIITIDNDLSDITPITIDGASNVHTVSEVPAGSNHLSTITTMDQSSSHTSLPVTVALVPNIVGHDQMPVMIKPISVITGSNSLGLIPKIINLDPNSHKFVSDS